MVFSSILFLLFFLPLFLACFFLTPAKFRNFTILAFSLFFYAWGAPLFIFVLIGSSFIDFALTREYKGHPKKHRSWKLIAALATNIGLLLYFKYANFFIESVNQSASFFGYAQIPWTNVALPVGISFFTFQKISYLIDIYRNSCRPLKKFYDYLLFVSMFPQLVAGPIVRFKEIESEIRDREKTISMDQIFSGCKLFILGLAKKVLIANVLAQEIAQVFNHPVDSLSTTAVWVGMVGYAMQIYFDFSGYSDMAIGIGRMIGYHFPENFNFPYISKNITEFWQRWHMTLGRWMKEYLYIPLGGNKKGPNRTLLNLAVVFVFSGLWHGASWNFLIWGCYHGFFLVLERLIPSNLRIIKGVPAVLITFTLTVLGWVVFKFEDLDQISTIIAKMIGPQFSYSGLHPYSMKLIMVTSAALFFSWFGTRISEFILSFQSKRPVASTLLSGSAMLSLFFWVTGELASGSFNPFIYFKF